MTQKPRSTVLASVTLPIRTVVPVEPDAVPNNLYGNLGPRCPHCSGLGRVLALGTERGPTRYTSRCRCGGTGVDQEAVRQGEMDRLLRRLATLEEQFRQQLAITSRSRQPQGKCSRQYWEEMIAWATASGTAVANTTTETILFPNVTIPANYMQDGRHLRQRVIGQYSTTATPTMIFGTRWGGVAGTLLCKTAACTTPSGVTAAVWDLDILNTTRTNGSSGTLMCNGTARVFAAVAGTVASATGEGLVTPMTNGGVVTPAVATVDLTADTALSVTLTWSAASASNTATGLQYIIESLN